MKGFRIQEDIKIMERQSDKDAGDHRDTEKHDEKNEINVRQLTEGIKRFQI